MRTRRAGRQGGVTLVELILAMVIVGVAVGGMLAAFNTTSKRSADPIVQKQLAVVAEGMMEEILLKPFDVEPNLAVPGRDGFTDVRDFDCYNLIVSASTGCADEKPIREGIFDVSDNAIAALRRYTVGVRVLPVALTGVPVAQALRITVTVTNIDSGENFVLTGWRLDFA